MAPKGQNITAHGFILPQRKKEGKRDRKANMNANTFQSENPQ